MLKKQLNIFWGKYELWTIIEDDTVRLVNIQWRIKLYISEEYAILICINNIHGHVTPVYNNIHGAVYISMLLDCGGYLFDMVVRSYTYDLIFNSLDHIGAQ